MTVQKFYFRSLVDAECVEDLHTDTWFLVGCAEASAPARLNRGFLQNCFCLFAADRQPADRRNPRRQPVRPSAKSTNSPRRRLADSLADSMSDSDSEPEQQSKARGRRLTEADVSSDSADEKYGAGYSLAPLQQKKSMKAAYEAVQQLGLQRRSGLAKRGGAGSSSSSAAMPAAPPALTPRAERELRRVELIDAEGLGFHDYVPGSGGQGGRRTRPEPPSSRKRKSMEARENPQQQRRTQQQHEQPRNREEAEGREGEEEDAAVVEDLLMEEEEEEEAEDGHAREEEAGVYNHDLEIRTLF